MRSVHKGCSGRGLVWAFWLIFTTSGWALADDAPVSKVDPGDTAWMLTSAALVLLMTPALGFFYGGMVRGKNVLGTIMHSFFMIAIISVQWAILGYSLSFGPDIGHFVGNLDWAFLSGVGGDPNPDYAPTIPHQAFMIYQAMFAVITPALISGAFAERMRFSAFVVFSLAWATIVYDPIAHWVWGVNGWLHNLGALDFAGGTVVHISSGVAALVAALVLGPRLGYPKETILPNNLTLTVLGAGILWFGWFGFNGGSALASGALATSAFVVTHMATAAATLGWAAAECYHRGKASVLGAASGAVAGLVAITPASGFVDPVGALIIGIAAGVVCYISAVWVKKAIGYDDSLDAWGVHGVGGALGAMLTGAFAKNAINSAGKGWLTDGNAGQMLIQFYDVAAVFVYCGIMTFIILKVISIFVPLRMSEAQLRVGDDAVHGETAYALGSDDDTASAVAD